MLRTRKKGLKYEDKSMIFRLYSQDIYLLICKVFFHSLLVPLPSRSIWETDIKLLSELETNDMTAT
jgi:hypothetical protein